LPAAAFIERKSLRVNARASTASEGLRAGNPEATAWVDTLPWTVHKPTDQQTDVERRYVLENQLLFMVEELKRMPQGK
jgi:hypothetical protein